MPLRQQINQSTSTSTSKSRHIHFAVITVAATTLVFFKSYAAESQTAKLAELYSDFKKVKIEMLEAQYTKKNFKSQFSKSYTLLKQKYEELQKTENLIKKDTHRQNYTSYCVSIDLKRVGLNINCNVQFLYFTVLSRGKS
mgnify:CR=1 FL=1